MFGLFATEEKKMRTNADNWLELADKIYNYRHDILSDTDRSALMQAMEKLKNLLREKADAAKLKLGIDALEPVLRKTGGRYYPRSQIQDWVEFFLVGAIVILGIRAYFAQPFKIPTNSMWPSYYGMTAEPHKTPADEPSLFTQAARFAFFGATPYKETAPIDGKLSIPLDQNGRIKFTPASGRTMFVLPAKVKRYEFRLSDQLITFDIPEDFQFDEAFYEATGLTPQDLFRHTERNSNGQLVSKLPREYRKGDTIFNFDLMSGDLLFVNRFSYHFFKPDVGEGFVFRTGNIPLLQSDSYYIKRLAGLPGDVLEIKEPVLYRNGEPITGADAFSKNANREGLYRGYANGRPDPRYLALLKKGEKDTVPADQYFALGDNSYNSLDGRSWGFVPAKDVVGKPLFIYYPFTKRWGLAK